MKKKIVRVPILNGYVEIAQEKYDALVANGELDAFKARYEPKHASASMSVTGGSTHIIPNVRRNPSGV